MTTTIISPLLAKLGFTDEKLDLDSILGKLKEIDRSELHSSLNDVASVVEWTGVSYKGFTLSVGENFLDVSTLRRDDSRRVEDWSEDDNCFFGNIIDSYKGAVWCNPISGNPINDLLDGTKPFFTGWARGILKDLTSMDSSLEDSYLAVTVLVPIVKGGDLVVHDVVIIDESGTYR